MSLKVRSVKTNMIMNAILAMSQFIFPLITFPYISRILLPEGTGKLNFATSVVSYFAMFSQLGIPTYGIRACARVRDDKEKLSKTVHELLAINLCMCVIVYIVFGISIININRLNQERQLFYILGLSIVLNALGVEWLYRALEQYAYITVRSLIFKALAVICMFLFVHKKEDYIIYGFISVLASSASCILNFYNLRKHIIVNPFKVGKLCISQHIRMILLFFSMSIATTIYTNLDNVMLGFMKGNEEVGYYGAAVKIKSILVSLVTSASSVLLPRASYYVDKNMREKFYEVLRKTMHFIILSAIPMAIYSILYAKESIFFLSGNEYENAITPMRIIMPTLILIGITNILGIQMMIPLEMERKVLESEVVGAIVDFGLNLILIPTYGASGAAVGTLVAETIVLIYQSVAVRNIPVQIYKEVSFFKIFFASFAAIIAAIMIKLLKISNICTLLISAVVFFGMYFLIMLIWKDTIVIDTLKQIYNRFNAILGHQEDT